MNHNWVNCCRPILQHIKILLSNYDYREKFIMLIIQINTLYILSKISSSIVLKHKMEVKMKFSKMNFKLICMIFRIVIRVNETTMFSKDI